MNTRTPARTSRAAVVAVAAVLLAVGWTAWRTTTGGEPASAPQPPVPVPNVAAAATKPVAGPVSVAGPMADVSGVPTGYAQSPAGARAAAVGWVSSLGALLQLGPIAASDALRAVTSDRVAAATVESFRAERARFRDEFHVDPSVGVWIESPLAVTVIDWSPQAAQVRVWSQVAVGVASAEPVGVLWRTHTLGLVWERDDWRIDTTTITEGPTLQPLADQLPSSGADIAAMAAWTPAVLAGSSGDGE
jgi:hypothetical protein